MLITGWHIQGLLGVRQQQPRSNNDGNAKGSGAFRGCKAAAKFRGKEYVLLPRKVWRECRSCGGLSVDYEQPDGTSKDAASQQ